MAKRIALFVVWAAIGTAFSFGALYFFTPLGVGFLVPGVLAAWWLEGRSEPRAPEKWGMLAGPGVLMALVAWG